MCLCAGQLKFDFKLTSDAKIQPAMQGRQLLLTIRPHHRATNAYFPTTLGAHEGHLSKQSIRWLAT